VFLSYSDDLASLMIA